MFIHESLRSLKRVEFAHVNHLQVVFHQAHDSGTMADRQVEINDTELVWEAIHQREQAGREGMDATESECIEVSGER